METYLKLFTFLTLEDIQTVLMDHQVRRIYLKRLALTLFQLSSVTPVLVLRNALLPASSLHSSTEASRQF